MYSHSGALLKDQLPVCSYHVTLVSLEALICYMLFFLFILLTYLLTKVPPKEKESFYDDIKVIGPALFHYQMDSVVVALSLQ